MGRKNVDVSSGMEGLVRMFASNTASSEIIKSYTRPILNDRLDLLEGPKTTDIRDYQQISTYFSNIAEYANKVYDLIFVDLNKNVPKENQEKLFSVSSVIVVGLSQTPQAIEYFNQLKEIKTEKIKEIRKAVMVKKKEQNIKNKKVRKF